MITLADALNKANQLAVEISEAIGLKINIEYTDIKRTNPTSMYTYEIRVMVKTDSNRVKTEITVTDYI